MLLVIGLLLAMLPTGLILYLHRRKKTVSRDPDRPTVIRNPDCVDVTDDRIYQLLTIGRNRYVNRLDARGAAIQFGALQILLMKPDGVSSRTGQPYISVTGLPEGPFAAAYYDDKGPFIFVANPDALDHEAIHYIDNVLNPTLARFQPGTGNTDADRAATYRWQIVEHGTPDDPFRIS